MDRENDLATLESSGKCGNLSASNLLTSDSASGRTAFTLAVRSGVNSTPDSRETGNGVVMDTSGAGSNMASSARLHGNGIKSAGTGKGVSNVEGNGDLSSWAGHGTGHGTVAGSATAQTVRPQASESSAMPQGVIGNSLEAAATTKQQPAEASAMPQGGVAGRESMPASAVAPMSTVAIANVSVAEKPSTAPEKPPSAARVITPGDPGNSGGV